MGCSSRYERAARIKGFVRVAGLDEAGRGCLFGPVYAAAVILDGHRPIRGLDDSKRLDPDRRTVLAARIRERATAWAVASVNSDVIDRINILQASRLAMRLALEQLQPQPDFLLVDAVKLDTALPQRPLIHGDALSFSIAAASILAKVHRDEAMAEWDTRFPGYGLASNKGYCTPDHLKALQQLGPTPHHRFSYEPVRLAAGPPPQMTLFAEAASE